MPDRRPCPPSPVRPAPPTRDRSAEHERLPLAQDRQGEPWNATPCQLRSDEVIEAVCGERRRKRRTQDREDYDTSHLARGGSVQSVGGSSGSRIGSGGCLASHASSGGRILPNRVDCIVALSTAVAG